MQSFMELDLTRKIFGSKLTFRVWVLKDTLGQLGPKTYVDLNENNTTYG